MKWEYMDSLGYRYEIVAKAIDFTGKAVVELNSGNTGLYELVKDKVKSYRACDVRQTHPIVEVIDDEAFTKTVTECDILCLFGHGGYEITKAPVESQTVTNSYNELITRCKPQYAVLESVSKFLPITQRIIEKHSYTWKRIDTKDLDWLKDRIIFIGERK